MSTVDRTIQRGAGRASPATCPSGGEPTARGGPRDEVEPLGVDDTARVRLPTAEECASCGLVADEPVVEIQRWDGNTELYQGRGACFSFVGPEQDPGNGARLAKLREIAADLSSVLRSGQQLPTEERMVVRYQVSRRTLRRALREVRGLGGGG